MSADDNQEIPVHTYDPDAQLEREAAPERAHAPMGDEDLFPEGAALFEESDLSPGQVAGVLALSSEMPLMATGLWLGTLLSWEYNADFFMSFMIGLMLFLSGILAGITGRFVLKDGLDIGGALMGGVGTMIAAIFVSFFACSCLWEAYFLSFGSHLIFVSAAAALSAQNALRKTGHEPDAFKVFIWTTTAGLTGIFGFGGYYLFASLASYLAWVRDHTGAASSWADILYAPTRIPANLELLTWYLSEHFGSVFVGLIIAIGFIIASPFIEISGADDSSEYI